MQNRIVEDKEDLSQAELDKHTNYLNEVLVGISLEEVKVKIEEELQKEQNVYDKLLSKALQLGKTAFGKDREPELYMEGEINLLECPEFAEVGRMKNLLHALDEKKLLVHLLGKTMDASGVQIFIGSEVQLSDMQTLSIISSPYRHGKKCGRSVRNYWSHQDGLS